MDAVIRTGGKQYRVHEGTRFQVATMAAEPGSRVELRDVLLVSDNGNTTVGSPTVANAVVVAEVIEHGRGKKVINFKYKAKVRYRRKRGHRQGFTTLTVREVRIGDAPAEARPVATAAPIPAPEPTPASEPAPNAVPEEGDDAEIDASDIVQATMGESSEEKA